MPYGSVVTARDTPASLVAAFETLKQADSKISDIVVDSVA